MKIKRASIRPQAALQWLAQNGVKDVASENMLLVVHNEATKTASITLSGTIGRSFWDDSGITAKEFKEALDAIPVGTKIKVIINSEGGSVKEGLEIYDAILARSADITCRIAGYALSIASVFPLAASRVESPDHAIWMIHEAWMGSSGNKRDKLKDAEMLGKHDAIMAGLYAKRAGKTADYWSAKMESETWYTGAEAIAAGLAHESGDDDAEDDIEAAAPRPIFAEYIAACKNIPANILNCLAPQGGAKKPTPTPTPENKMNKKIIVALLIAQGINLPNGQAFTEAATDLEFEAGLQALAKKPGVDATVRMDAIEAKQSLIEKRRIQDKVNTYVDAKKITKAQAGIYVAAMITDEAGTIAILDEIEAPQAGGHAGAFLDTLVIDRSPAVSANGVQGSKILPEIDNIFAVHKMPAGATKDQKMGVTAARYEAMKEEFPRLLNAAFKRDNGVQGANTFSGTVTTNFLIMGVTIKTANRFAAANLFTMDAEQDPYKPLAAGIRKFNVTTTDGTKVGKNVTNFQTLAGGTNGNPDSVVNAITITPDQYTSGGYITNAQLNSGFRVADIIEPKIIDLADQITQCFTAPITVANFVTNAALVSAPGVFGFSDLATLQGQLKKVPVKNCLLDGEYIARISNVPGFFQGAGTVGGPANAWAAYGWDNIALNTEWAGAGANVRGFACGKTAIGIISGIPLNPPEGIPGNIVQTGVAQLPDVQKSIGTYVWFDPSTRTLYFTFDMIAGATLIDETAGILIKAA